MFGLSGEKLKENCQSLEAGEGRKSRETILSCLFLAEGEGREGGGPRLPGALKDEPALSNPIYASTWPAPSRLRKNRRGSSEGRDAQEGAGLGDNLRG